MIARKTCDWGALPEVTTTLRFGRWHACAWNSCSKLTASMNNQNDTDEPTAGGQKIVYCTRSPPLIKDMIMWTARPTDQRMVRRRSPKCPCMGPTMLRQRSCKQSGVGFRFWSGHFSQHGTTKRATYTPTSIQSTHSTPTPF